MRAEFREQCEHPGEVRHDHSLHGSVFEFFRNDDLNANNFFSNRSGTPRGELKQTPIGIALGGPVRKDKIFYFLSYQGTRQLNGVASQGYQADFLPPQLTNDRSAATLGREFCPANNPAGSPYARIPSAAAFRSPATVRISARSR